MHGKFRKLSPAQRSMLERVRNGGDTHDGLQGRNEHGAASGTRSSLLRHGLLGTLGGRVLILSAGAAALRDGRYEVVA